MKILVCFPLLALLIATGCGKPASHLTQAPPAALPQDWNVATNEKFGLTLGIAPGWREGQASMAAQMGLGGDTTPDPYGDPNAQALKDSLAKANQSNAVKEREQLEKDGILMLISDGSRTLPGEEPNQYVIQHVSLPGEMDIENGAKVAREELEFAHNPEFIDTPMGKAARFILNYSNKSGDKIHKVMYVFVDGKEMYELKLSNTGQDNRIKAIADQVAQSFRIKPGLVFEAVKS